MISFLALTFLSQFFEEKIKPIQWRGRNCSEKLPNYVLIGCVNVPKVILRVRFGSPLNMLNNWLYDQNNDLNMHFMTFGTLTHPNVLNYTHFIFEILSPPFPPFFKARKKQFYLLISDWHCPAKDIGGKLL